MLKEASPRNARYRVWRIVGSSVKIYSQSAKTEAQMRKLHNVSSNVELTPVLDNRMKDGGTAMSQCPMCNSPKLVEVFMQKYPLCNGFRCLNCDYTDYKEFFKKGMKATPTPFTENASPKTCSREGCPNLPTQHKKIDIGGHVFEIHACNKHFEPTIVVTQAFSDFVIRQEQRRSKEAMP